MSRFRQTLALVLSLLPVSWPVCAADAPTLSIYPTAVTLRGKAARQRLLVTERNGGKALDRTSSARFRSEAPAVVAVSAAGILSPVGDGRGSVTAEVDGKQTRVAVRVVAGTRLLPVTFERDVEPVLARYGCNSGACHGKASGQNGFKLSLLGYDPAFDHAALTREARGRRVFPAAPKYSLLLRKASGQMPHGGGRRLPADGAAFDLLRRWIAAGCPHTAANAPKLERITIEPAERILTFRGEQQLVVTAHYTDGSAEDVTHLATFQSNESVFAAVDADGRVHDRAAAGRGSGHGPLHGEIRRLQRPHSGAGFDTGCGVCEAAAAQLH